MFAWRTFFTFCAALLFGCVLNAAQAQNSTPSQRVVAGCVGYGTGLADDISGAGRNTPAWDNVFRPAREECLRRNGPENMPNGSMFAPYYQADSGGGGGGGGVDVSKYLPPGMGWQQAVQAGYDGCLAEATTIANTAGAQGSPDWTRSGRTAVRQCIAKGGRIGNRYYTPLYPAVKAGLRALIEPSYACETLEDGSRICVDSSGNAVYCPAGTTGLRNCTITTIITVNGDPYQLSDLTTNFFNCAGGSCLAAVPNDSGGPRGGGGGGGNGGGNGKPGPTLPVEIAVKNLLGQCVAELERNGIDPYSEVALKNCMTGRCVRAGYTPEQCLAQIAKQISELLAVLAAGGVAKKYLQRFWETTKDVLSDTLENIKNDPYAKPGLVLIGIGLVTLVCIDTGGACLVILPRLVPAAAGVLGVSVTGAGNGKSSGNRSMTAEQAVNAYCRGVVTRAARNAGWNAAPAVIDGFTQICTLSVPGRGDRQALAAALVADCDRAGMNAVRNAGTAAPETAYSRAANQCLRLRAGEVMTFGQVPELTNQFATRLTDELQSCAERAGLEWQGNDLTGAAVPPPGGVRNGLALMSNCLRAWPATVQ